MPTPARAAAIAGGVVGGLLLVAGATFLGVSQARADEVIEGVTVEGIDVGGLGREDAAAEIQRYADERSSERIVFVHEDQEFVVEPVEVGAGLDVDEVVDRALSAGREGSWIEARWASITGVDIALSAPISLDEELVTERVEEIADEVDEAPVEGDVTIDETGPSVEVVLPSEGLQVITEEAVTDAVAAFDERGEDRLELPVEVLTTLTTEQVVTDAAAVAERAIAADLTLASADGQVVLGPREVASLITIDRVEGDDSVSFDLSVTSDAVTEHVVPVAGPLLRDPVNADLQAPRSPPRRFDPQGDTTWRPVPATVTIVPGRNGTAVDVDRTAEQLTEAVLAGTRRVDLELATVPAAFSTEDAERANVNSLLSTFTTYYSCCPPRVRNIQLLADIIDDTLVLPGEQFSINQTSGLRGCEQGFAEDGMILNGEIVPVCGGGVSQFGTTTVNAVFFSGFRVDAYKPHSFYISRYPMAREATLNYPSPDIDVRFTNDSAAPVVIRTSYDDTSITVSFYGNTDVAEVRADVGSPYDVRSYDSERRQNSSLPPGTSTVIQTGQDGFSVELTRTVVREGGSTASDDWGWTYVPKKEIIEFNPASAPAPDPSPSDDGG